MRKLLTIVAIVAVLLFVRMSLYTVDASEYVYLTVLGRHVATHDGKADGAGLHVGWPWPVRSMQRLDARLQSLDLPVVELLLPDEDKKTIDKNLSVQAYVTWRIASAEAVEQFIQSMGTVERAQTILRQSLVSQLNATISQRRMSIKDFINTKPGHVDDELEKLRVALKHKVEGPVREKFGIELVDVRLKRFYYPENVRGKIFDTIRSERAKKVAEIRNKGELEARNIESKAKEDGERAVNQALAKDKSLKDLADAEAAYLTNQAYAKDEKFYALLKSLENLERILSDNRSLLLLSTQHPLFKLLLQTPGTDPKKSGPQPKKGGT